MTFEINETHDPNLKSWIESANAPDTDFPIQNLPFCIFRYWVKDDDFYGVGVAIGDKVLNITGCLESGLLNREKWESLEDSYESLNEFSRYPRVERFRTIVSQMLQAEFDNKDEVAKNLLPLSEVELLKPFEISNYTDFYCSIFHATNVGAMFRPDNPLLPNYKYIPIGYHGRASSIVVSGTDVKRPKGQTRPDAEQPPSVYSVQKFRLRNGSRLFRRQRQHFGRINPD